MKAFQRAQVFGLRFLLVGLFFYCGSALAEQVKDLPKPTDYVSDYAHVLSAQTVAQLDSLCSQLDHSKANAQVAVVTVHNLDGDDAADFADQLEDKWKMGKKGSDRGVLYLLAVDDHKYRIEVGYGLEGILNDAKIGDIGRAMVPYLRARDYDSAVLLAVGQLAQVIATDAGVTLENQPEMAPPARTAHQGGGSPISFFLLIFLFFGGIFAFTFHCCLQVCLAADFAAARGWEAASAEEALAAAALAAVVVVAEAVLGASAAAALAAAEPGEAGRVQGTGGQ